MLNSKLQSRLKSLILKNAPYYGMGAYVGGDYVGGKKRKARKRKSGGLANPKAQAGLSAYQHWARQYRLKHPGASRPAMSHAWALHKAKMM